MNVILKVKTISEMETMVFPEEPYIGCVKGLLILANNMFRLLTFLCVLMDDEQSSLLCAYYVDCNRNTIIW